jgi:hypothetical protein
MISSLMVFLSGEIGKETLGCLIPAKSFEPDASFKAINVATIQNLLFTGEFELYLVVQ